MSNNETSTITTDRLVNTLVNNFKNIVLEFKEPSLAILYLGSEDHKTVTLTEDRMNEISQAFDLVKERKSQALIITGPLKKHDEMFTVGADLQMIRSVTDPAEGERLAKMGQNIFEKLADLQINSIAAISGPCVGGGFELALACKYRICSDHRSTIIGLPEIKLGILPGFGGCQRLPRLIGLRTAVDFILQGQTVSAKTALGLGLVDEIVSVQHLLNRAESIVLGKVQTRLKKLSTKERLLTYTSLGRYLIQMFAIKSLNKKGSRHYPAPLEALKVMSDGLAYGHSYGLQREAEAIGRLITSDVSKALVRLFFITEKAKAIGKGVDDIIKDMQGVVVGAGIMGRGIALASARKGIPVTLKDIDENALQKARVEIAGIIKKSSLSAGEQESVIDRIRYTTNDSFQIGSNNFAIEAVLEKMDLKKKILSSLSATLPTGSIIATNTSALSVSEMAEAVQNPSCFIGMHFFNPVHKMALVEIVRGKRTSEKTIVLTAALAKQMGKIPIIVEDSPGFLVNRILTPYLSAALLLLTKGYKVLEIDEAALAFGLPMGPLRLLDEVGHDVALHVGETMHSAFPDRFGHFILSKNLVEEGSLGRKSMKGIYDYTASNGTPRSDLKPLLEAPPAVPILKLTREQITEALILPLVQEAVRCHDEAIAGQPGIEAAEQIDLGSIMGIGFPAYTGGALHYASKLGAKQIAEKLKFYQEELNSPLYDIPTGVQKRSEKNIAFDQV
jgi:3-hydroxyacyl-CoA dehydrogenase/enoyl-CoA hydratase/3-hydroxybutyryl-CoA epimerase